MQIFHKVKKQWRLFFPGPQAKRVKPWFVADGDYKHRLTYDELDENSLVVDLGGYKGQWASDIFGRYQCRVLVFEPAAVYCELISKRFIRNSRINVYPYALSNENKTELLYINADKSSAVKKEGKPEQMNFRKFDEMMRELSVESIDLLKINIEGGEYDLLDYIIATGWVRKIRNIQVQFHDFFPDAVSRMNKIRSALSLTHDPTYQYEFVWENWKIRKL